ncbi:ABC transporter permease [Sporolactobacillus nakayamae]|uniref:Putative ABC transport system permease protein n=1 Tax=Sporolactobacillus nakayamae TaxID=269670 RepID=A0A1I2REF1_9BACL|nr:ABC transporter permease [Sporolactobacillus nakayamae]SFG37869.1 putative ABC transport system permease protein [Sporolactobacillus nakayamae]
MTLFELARRNMARNFIQYFLYFGSMIISVLIFFIFVSIQYNDEAQAAAADSVKINTAFQAASIVLLIFVALFIWYSNSFFTKRRKKEIGLYALMGLRKKQIGWMLFFENLILGLMSLAVGMFIGMLLSKFFIMILMKLMHITVAVHFSISLPAILETIIVFLVIIVTASFYGYRLIYGFQLVELFRDEKKGDREPKVSIFQALLAVALIGTGYFLVLQDLKPPLWRLPIVALMMLLCIIAGTYLLFRSLTVFILKQMRKRKNVYYKGTNVIGISQLLYRMRGNARVLTVIAAMSAVTLVSVGTSYSFYYNAGEWTKNNFPHSYKYVIPVDQQDKAEQLLYKALRADGEQHKVTSHVSVPALNLDVQMLEYDGGSAEFDIISEAVYNQVAARYGQKDRIHLIGNEATMLAKFYEKKFKKSYIGHNGKIGSVESYENGGKKTFVHYVSYERTKFLQSTTVVVSDTMFQKLARVSKPLILNQIDVSGQEHLGKVDDQFLIAMNNLEKKIKERNAHYYGVFSFYGIYHSTMTAYGLIMFLGAFLGLVFLLATGSIIYFKQLNEAAQEKPQYAILRKVGLTNREIRGTIAKQAAFIFVLPLVMGVLHSTIALGALSRMIDDDLTVPAVICMGIYALIYFIYYLFTVRAYTKMVTS